MPDQLKQAINIKLKPSYLLLGLLVLIATLTLVSVEILPINIVVKLSLQLLIGLSTAYYVLRDALLCLPRSWQILAVSVQGEFLLTDKQGQTFKPHLANNSFIHPKLIILSFIRQPDKFRLPVCILFNHLAYAQQHRQLRVWLNWWKFDHDQLTEIPL